MAVKPSELEVLSEADVALVNLAEQETDELLKSQYNPYGSLFIFGMPPKIRHGSKAYFEFVRRYEEAGWNVRYDHKPNGDFLQFSLKGGKN